MKFTKIIKTNMPFDMVIQKLNNSVSNEVSIKHRYMETGILFYGNKIIDNKFTWTPAYIRKSDFIVSGELFFNPQTQETELHLTSYNGQPLILNIGISLFILCIAIFLVRQPIITILFLFFIPLIYIVEYSNFYFLTLKIKDLLKVKK